LEDERRRSKEIQPKEVIISWKNLTILIERAHFFLIHSFVAEFINAYTYGLKT